MEDGFFSKNYLAATAFVCFVTRMGPKNCPDRYNRNKGGDAVRFVVAAATESWSSGERPVRPFRGRESSSERAWSP
ncbi:hypothetical protein Poly41_15660 [Novipirellula artificiosorum]|uniref:Uncharacterized protein n=1 Tax=Novipirellula artificiosorum TaxID=2528016 RepID=A0A5C6DZ72_9BACT|nr:hypothetical protein Poly41_15660 [Novipirellula artificiosorum]